jgi:hypothetical protein
MAQSPLEAVRKLTTAWIAKDREGMSRWVTDDITELGPAHSQVVRGREIFLSKYRPYFAASVEIVAYHILRPRVVELSRGAALVYFRYRMRTRSGNDLIESHGKESMVVEKDRRGWRVMFIHWHEDDRRTRSGTEIDRKMR